MKAFTVRWNNEPVETASLPGRRHRGDVEYRSAVVIAADFAEASSKAANWGKENLPGFNIEEVDLDDNTVIL